MKSMLRLTCVAMIAIGSFAFTSCSTSEVGDARMSGVERRQDRIDSRTYARQDRWRERADRQDERVNARFESW